MSWRARGFLFENCSCQLVCPGHIHFDQLCTHERCRGYWAFEFEHGLVEGTDLAGQRAIVAFDSPQRMIDGGWTQVLLVDRRASAEEQRVLEAVFDGSLGGPWQVLGRFVSTRLPTRTVTIEMDRAPMEQRLRIPGLLDSTVAAIRGRTRGEPVRFENIFNQIHAPSQVIARGDADYDDGTIRFEHRGTHGLWSRFDWTVSE